MDGRRVFEEEFADKARLEALIGKEAAEKLWRNETTDDAGYPVRVLEGVDLRMGGEGMVGFYDKILPAYAAKFGKRFGTSVGKAQIRVGKDPRRAGDEAGLGLNDLVEEARNDDGQRGYRATSVDGDDLGWFEDLPSAVEAVQAAAPRGREPTTVHAMDITPSMRETALAEGFPLWQAGPGEPAARLSGRELGDFGDDVVALRTAARDYYARNLRGTSVEHPELGTVHFTQRGGRKVLSSSANPLKLRLFPALPEIIRGGRVEASTPNRDPVRHHNVKAFHWVTAEVEIAGERHKVGVTIREDTSGRLYYNHNLQEGESARFGAHSGPTSKAGGGTPGGTLLQGKVGGDDGLNITLLGAAGGKPPAAPRAAIVLGENMRRIILGETADPTSLVHELGHGWLDIIRFASTDPDAAPVAKQDWDTIRGWLGVAEGGKLTTDQHELFAKSFERYVAEGVAPTPELVGVFERFKQWMLQVYRSIEAIAPRIPDEIREIFDRYMAGDRALAEQRARNTQGPRPEVFDPPPPLRQDADPLEDLAESLGIDVGDVEVRLAQLDAAGRLAPEDAAALKEADELAAKAELYARAYAAAAACMT